MTDGAGRPQIPHPFPSATAGGQGEARRNGMNLSVMAGLDPAIHANTTTKESRPAPRLSGTACVRVDARLEGGHDGWGQACE